MASKKKGVVKVVTLKSTASGHTYQTIKNTKNTTEKLKQNKYDPRVMHHVPYVETKK